MKPKPSIARVLHASARHWRLGVTAVAVAALTGIGGHTFAQWSIADHYPAGTITAGDLNVALVANPIDTGAAVNWAVLDGSGPGAVATVISPNDHVVMPGERLVATATWRVTTVGENFNAELTFKNKITGAPVALGGSMSKHIEPARSRYGVVAGTVGPDGPLGTPLATAPLGQPLPTSPAYPITMTEDANGDTYTTYLDVTVTDAVNLDDLENEMVTVLNLDANLDQIRGVS